MNRKPILLSKNTCALVLIYGRTDEIFDALAGAYDNFDTPECWESAAREFIDQLKERWSPRFMEALRDEINVILEDNQKANDGNSQNEPKRGTGTRIQKQEL